ncbi:MAG: phage gp6-like head-tail connector protein [Firmicutes bacterium]|nr:phage gp6-like head-tail connector protein [Bacillota bacterium]
MALTLPEVITWLRLEQDDLPPDEISLLQGYLSAAKEQLKNATENVSEENALARLYMLAWIHDWYFRVSEMADTRKSLISQLQNSYPDGDGDTDGEENGEEG